MGHNPGFPCLYTPDDHKGRCSTPIIPPPADLSVTRYFVLGPNGDDYWRVNDTAPYGCQVEFRDRDGDWHTSILPTVAAFLEDIDGPGSVWREITAEEVPNA